MVKNIALLLVMLFVMPAVHMGNGSMVIGLRYTKKTVLLTFAMMTAFSVAVWALCMTVGMQTESVALLWFIAYMPLTFLHEAWLKKYNKKRGIAEKEKKEGIK